MTVPSFAAPPNMYNPWAFRMPNPMMGGAYPAGMYGYPPQMMGNMPMGYPGMPMSSTSIQQNSS